MSLLCIILSTVISTNTVLPVPPLPSEVVSRALSYLGRPYGAEQRKGPNLDCSGFVRDVFAGFGVHLPATSREQVLVGIAIPRHELRTGDLVFFSSPSSGPGKVGHVGLVIDVAATGSTWIVHSSTRGVRIDSLGSSGLGARFIEARRILSDRPIDEPDTFVSDFDDDEDPGLL
jgi:cell wall-associated NlpC family hydrolase